MATYAFYPPSGGGSSSNASVGPNGTPIPGSATLVAGENPSGNLQPLQTDNAGNLFVSIASEPLNPFNVNVADFGGTAVSLGQKASAASMPVVLASDQSILNVSDATTHTDLATINTTLGSPMQQTGGTVTVIQPSGASLHVDVDNFPATQPVSGTVTVVQPSGAALHADIDSLPSIPAGTNSIGTVGLNAGSNAIGSVTVSNFPATQPVSGTVTADQGTSPWVDNISQVGGAAISLGQTVSASSLPVVLASDQSSIPVASTPVTPAPLAITQAALTVGTTAVRLTVSGSAPASDRVALVVTPDSASTGLFYIGGSTVTSSGATRGIQIASGQVITFNNDAGDYWIVSNTAAQIVEIMEQS